MCVCVCVRGVCVCMILHKLFAIPSRKVLPCFKNGISNDKEVQLSKLI